MLKVKRRSWHLRAYNWFNKGKKPRIMELCSYCRTVMFWAPLKAIFYAPWKYLFEKNKVLFSLSMAAIAGGLCYFIYTSFGMDVLATLGIIIGAIVACVIFVAGFALGCAGLEELKYNEGWQELKEKKPVQCAKTVAKTGAKVVFWYPVILPLKVIFYTMWKKMFELSKVLFSIVLAIAVGLICWAVFVYLGTKVLIAIGISLGILTVTVGLIVLGIFLVDCFGNIDWDNNLPYQWILAKKHKICPFVEVED